MIEFKSTGVYFNAFDNIAELSKYVTERPRKPGRNDESEREEKCGFYSSGFYGTKDFNEAICLLKDGDLKLYESIKTEKKKINIEKIIGVNNQRLKYQNRLYGAVPNVPSYLKGLPINMINAEKKTPANRVLNIMLNIRVSGGVEDEEIKKIGSKYLTIIDILEKNGYRCNLYSGCANCSCGVHSYMLVRIKTDKEPLNLKKICFTIANPSMQRRIKFKWMEVNDCQYDFTRDGYGGQDSEQSIKKNVDEIMKDNFIIWGYEDGNKAKPIEMIIEDLKEKYGIRIGD